MRGFLAFLKKEIVEIVRTWRVWVLPGIMLFFALTTPLLTKLTPALLESFAAQQPGAIIRLPDPTYREAYVEHLGNLSQIIAIAVLIAFAGAVNGERRSGTAVLTLTKPLSRPAFVFAKTVAQTLLLFAAVVVGTVVLWLETLAVFGEAPAGPLFGATALWFAFGVLLVSIATLCSTLVRSQLGAAGLGLLAFAVLGLLNLWQPTQRYGPSGLLVAANDVAMGKAAEYGWSLAAALLAALAVVVLAAAVFRRQEL